MLLQHVAVFFLTGAAIAAPALETNSSSSHEVTRYRRETEYKPCIALRPQCCPDNIIGLTLKGPATLKCMDPASVASQSKFLTSCKNQNLIPYCCTPGLPLVGSTCRRIVKQ